MILETIKKYYNKKFVKDSSWLSFAKAIELIIAIIINLYIAKRQGNVGIGIFNQAYSFYMIFAILSNLGVSNSLVKFSSENPQYAKKVFNDHLYITILLSLPIIVIIIVITKSIPQLFTNIEVAKSVQRALFALPLFLLNKNFIAYLNSIRLIKDMAIIRIIRWIIMLVAIVMLPIVTKDEKSIYYSFIIAESILVIYCLIRYHKIIENPSKITIKTRYNNFGIKSLLSEIIATMNDKLRIIILGYIISKNEIGVYSMLLTITSSVYYLQQVLMQNINPIISKLYFESKFKELQRKIYDVMKVNTVISYAIIIMLIPLYMILTKYILTDQLDGYMKYFLILLISVMILSPFNWTGGVLIMGGYVKENFYRTLLIMIINISLLFIFGYFFGLMGVVVATIIINLAIVIIQNIAIKKTMNIRLIKL